MTDDLARRLAEHPRFEWMEGMLAKDVYGYMSRYVAGRGFVLPSGHHTVYARDVMGPSLDDPATQGCLLAMLGPRVGRVERCMALPDFTCTEWVIGDATSQEAHTGATLGEALARALLAAWGES